MNEVKIERERIKDKKDEYLTPPLSFCWFIIRRWSVENKSNKVRGGEGYLVGGGRQGTTIYASSRSAVVSEESLAAARGIIIVR